MSIFSKIWKTIKAFFGGGAAPALDLLDDMIGSIVAKYGTQAIGVIQGAVQAAEATDKKGVEKFRVAMDIALPRLLAIGINAVYGEVSVLIEGAVKKLAK